MYAIDELTPRSSKRTTAAANDRELDSLGQTQVSLPVACVFRKRFLPGTGLFSIKILKKSRRFLFRFREARAGDTGHSISTSHTSLQGVTKVSHSLSLMKCQMSDVSSFVEIFRIGWEITGRRW